MTFILLKHRGFSHTTLFYIVVVGLVVALDQLSKFLVCANKEIVEDLIIPGFYFTVQRNSGAAFSVGQGLQLLYIAIALVIAVLVTLYVIRTPKLSFFVALGLGLVVGGGLSNCWDRITTAAVFDFIGFSWFDFPIFNVADIAITIGTVLLLDALLIGLFSTSNKRGNGDEELL